MLSLWYAFNFFSLTYDLPLNAATSMPEKMHKVKVELKSVQTLLQTVTDKQNNN